MSIFGAMKTAISGMNAQANRLGAVGDNIANSSTIGYKRASTAFSSLVLPTTQGSYSSGGVETKPRRHIFLLVACVLVGTAQILIAATSHLPQAWGIAPFDRSGEEE